MKILFNLLAFLLVSPEQLSDYNVATCAIFDVYCENVKMWDFLYLK